MKKRILTILLCVSLVAVGIAGAAADARLGGDANGDGKVTASDAALVLRYSVGLDDRMTVANMLKADVNGNGEIDPDDAVSILRYVAGLAPLMTTATDAETLRLLNVQSTLGDDLTEFSARFLYNMPEGDVRKVLYEGAKLLGTPYGKEKDGKLDCSAFVKTAYRNAGISTSVYPGGSSDGVWKWFQTNRPRQLHETDDLSWKDWKPGCILIYTRIDESSNEEIGSHLALYVGEIGGEPIVIESRQSGCDGVRIGYLMGSVPGRWDLRFYVDPLG